MIVLALVFGAAILLTLLVVFSYSPEGAHTVYTGPRKRSTRADGSDAGWIFGGTDGGTDGGAGDCGAADAGGSCGDGGGGGD